MTLSRRQFIRLLGASGATLAVVGPDGLAASAVSAPAYGGPGGGPGGSAPVLVVITLYGGNDGLNTVIPVGDSAYAGLRGPLAIDPATTHPLADGYALHPSLPSFKALWDSDRLAVVHGVGFADLDRSHFHCMDTWQAGDEHDHRTGWLGRWLDLSDGDPLSAVSVGATLPLLLRGSRRSAAVVDVGPLEFPDAGALRAPFEMSMAVSKDRSPLAARAAESGTDLVNVIDGVGPIVADARPSSGRRPSLAAQLEIVSDLLAGGIGASVYSVSLGGFDTHANQLERHAELLTQLDGGVGSFLDSVGDRPVTVLVHSEFGRRVAPNGSSGTDHGKAGPVMVAGTVQPGFHGEAPGLAQLDDGDLRATTDFRSVYGAVLEGVLATSAADVVPGAPAPLALV